MTISKTKYGALDEQILLAVADVPRPFHMIFSRSEVYAECRRLAANEGKAAEADRVLDRRLQALRKAGRIHHTAKGWAHEESRT